MKPILFRTDMVRAILDGTKTQTRRIIKPQPKEGSSGFKLCRPLDDCFGKECIKQFGVMYKPPKKEWLDDTHPMWNFVKCPYGQPGNKLWVRETFAYCEDMGILDADGNPADHLYKADEPWDTEWGGKWTPSIYMPRELSRIILEITNIRVERVQDITGEDAIKEGWPKEEEMFPLMNAEDKALLWFKKLWDKLNLKRGYGWDGNQWVWVLDFKRVEQEANDGR